MTFYLLILVYLIVVILILQYFDAIALKCELKYMQSPIKNIWMQS